MNGRLNGRFNGRFNGPRMNRSVALFWVAPRAQPVATRTAPPLAGGSAFPVDRQRTSAGELPALRRLAPLSLPREGPLSYRAEALNPGTIPFGLATNYGRFTGDLRRITDDLRAICDELRAIYGRFATNYGRFTGDLRRITSDLRAIDGQFATNYG